MTLSEQRQLDELVEIADEDDSPLSEWEQEFVRSLDARRDCDSDMTLKQADIFDRLVKRHLK